MNVDPRSGMDAPYCCGATIWCYADHPWPEEPYFHALMMSNFGIVTRDRHPRRALAAVQRMFTERARRIRRPRRRGDEYPSGA